MSTLFGLIPEITWNILALLSLLVLNHHQVNTRSYLFFLCNLSQVFTIFPNFKTLWYLILRESEERKLIDSFEGYMGYLSEGKIYS